MGVSYDDLGCYEKAEDVYKKAIKYNPNYGDAHHNLGIALDNQGKIEEAIKSY
jgi:tetratricopeptide (TPR) repeat protein